MNTLPGIHQRIKEAKAKRQDLRTIVKDELASSASYKSINEQIAELKTKKARIEAAVRERLQKELQEIEILSNGIKNDIQLMSDLAVTQLMKGQTVELKDEGDNEYEPVIKVTFKKK